MDLKLIQKTHIYLYKNNKNILYYLLIKNYRYKDLFYYMFLLIKMTLFDQKYLNNMKKEFVNEFLLKDNFFQKNKKKLVYYENQLTKWSLKYDFIDYIKLENDFNKDIVKMYSEAVLIFKDKRFRLINHDLPNNEHLLFQSSR